MFALAERAPKKSLEIAKQFSDPVVDPQLCGDVHPSVGNQAPPEQDRQHAQQPQPQLQASIITEGYFRQMVTRGWKCMLQPSTCWL